MQHEFEPVSEKQVDPPAAIASAEAATRSQPSSVDAWWARETARGHEARLRKKQEKLQSKLRAAESYRKVGKWACFATGVVWNVGILTTLVQAVRGARPGEPGLILMIPWILLPLWGLVYLVGSLRRFLVLHAARRHGIELDVRHPILRRWLVVEAPGSPEAVTATFVAPLPGEGASRGAQLDASLARDRSQRYQRERAVQRKLDAACRFEQWGRRDCLWAAHLSLVFWASLLTNGGPQLPTGLPLLFLFVSGIGGTVGLALGTLAVLAAKLRQRLVLKQARAEALEVVRVNNSASPIP